MTFVLILSVPLQGAFASSKSPYDSGYDHGCDDAGISNPSDRYINQPEKGPSFHTSEFMNGYYDGVASCEENNAGEYYQEPLQTQNAKTDSFGDDLKQLAECATQVAPLAAATGTIGTVIGGLGCGISAAQD